MPWVLTLTMIEKRYLPEASIHGCNSGGEGREADIVTFFAGKEGVDRGGMGEGGMSSLKLQIITTGRRHIQCRNKSAYAGSFHRSNTRRLFCQVAFLSDAHSVLQAPWNNIARLTGARSEVNRSKRIVPQWIPARWTTSGMIQQAI